MTENNMEVVAWIWRGPHGGVIASEEKPSWHSTPLVTLTSAQAEIERLTKARDAINEENLVLLQRIRGYKARTEAAEKERDALREALKPSGDTKAAYMGEFTIAIERHLNDDDLPEDEAESAVDPYEHVSVPWATIKEIMAAIRARALQPLEP